MSDTIYSVGGGGGGGGLQMARRGECGGYLLVPFIFGIVTILPRNIPKLSLGYIYFGVNQVWFTVR